MALRIRPSHWAALGSGVILGWAGPALADTAPPAQVGSGTHLGDWALIIAAAGTFLTAMGGLAIQLIITLRRRSNGGGNGLDDRQQLLLKLLIEERDKPGG